MANTDNSIDLSDSWQRIRQLGREVRQFVRKEPERLNREGIQGQGRNNRVTYVDKAGEERLVKGLTAIIPGAGFITEEDTSQKPGKSFEWIIDPIDGTLNYVNNLPPYSISIALRQNEEVVLGVVYEIVLQECFYSWKGERAYLNERPIRVSPVSRVEDSLLATGFPYGDLKELDEYLEVFKHFMFHSQGIRRLGSAAIDLVYVACGRFEGFYEYDLKAWDVAAGSFIVQQAGGTVTDFAGQDNFIFGGEIVAACPAIQEEIRKVVAHYMK
jgi:myo-inositol-1(or 4)-monophosphatase